MNWLLDPAPAIRFCSNAESILGAPTQPFWYHQAIVKIVGCPTNEPKHIQERGSWQYAAELMILAAERGGSIEAATTQIEDTLFLEARL
jgi:hypothetical protein